MTDAARKIVDDAISKGVKIKKNKGIIVDRLISVLRNSKEIAKRYDNSREEPNAKTNRVYVNFKECEAVGADILYSLYVVDDEKTVTRGDDEKNVSPISLYNKMVGLSCEFKDMSQGYYDELDKTKKNLLLAQQKIKENISEGRMLKKVIKEKSEMIKSLRGLNAKMKHTIEEQSKKICESEDLWLIVEQENQALRSQEKELREQIMKIDLQLFH